MNERVTPDYKALIAIIAEGCDVDAATTDSELKKRLNYYSVRASIAASPGWPKPAEVESKIEAVRKAARALRHSIEDLDNFTRSAVRRSANKAQERAIERLTAAAKANDRGEIAAAQEDLDKSMNAPVEECIDFALLSSLDQFEEALTKQGELVVSIAPVGAGRPKNLAAYRLAEVAVKAHLEFTGTKPTFWNGGETPFSRMLDALFHAAGVKAATRKPYEAAMLKFCPDR
ncbi:hypothetical protein [Paracoccus aeridis]|uniref:hypothetical protein n=1 Tax=Paracoccus aeridis TaxID=1966466 RepID=UPI0010AAD3D6|nr:hypothetical protein [Paracoccus aeridis]